MKRHGRSHVLERELAVGGHIMRARLTRGEGITRADRGLDNPHESPLKCTGFIGERLV